MALYRTIETCFWDDPKFKKCSRESLALAMFLITGPQSHESGLYILNRSVVFHYLQMKDEEFSTALHQLIEIGFCKWDEERSVVWVVNMFKRQPHHGLHLNRVKRHFLTLFESPLIEEFFQKYPQCRDMGHQVVTKSHQQAPSCHQGAPTSTKLSLQKQNTKVQSTPPISPPLEGGGKSRKSDKPIIIHDPDRLKKICSSLDISRQRAKYGSKIDVDLCFEEWSNWMVGKCNCQDHHDFQLSFSNWCIREVKNSLARGQPRPPSPNKPDYVDPPEF